MVSHQTNFVPTPLQTMSDLSVSQGPSSFVVDDIAHEPREIRPAHPVEQNIQTKICNSKFKFKILKLHHKNKFYQIHGCQRRRSGRCNR